MNKKNIFDMIFSIIFVGVILSFGLYFALTLALRPHYDIESSYFDGDIHSEISRDIFSDFDDACYKNSAFYKRIVEVEYKMFGALNCKTVIKGDGNFLFPTGTNKFGYDYLDDYTGSANIAAADLDKIYQCLEMRRKAYENQGQKYYIVVIPNSQSVYSEYLPDYYGEKSDKTLILLTKEYLSAKGFDSFVDLTDGMLEAKSNGLLYNNTENSLNALGAYYVYEAIMNKIIADGVVEEKILDSSFFDFHTNYTNGKGAAIEAGIENLIKNETVSIANPSEYTYTTVKLFEDLETTYIKSGYKDEDSDEVSILLELSGEWDKIQLMPYFSSTFGITSYRVSHIFSKGALESSSPDVVLQFIHEDELWSVVNPMAVDSYNEGLKPGENPYQTLSPIGLKYSVADDNTVYITGEVEKGSVVSIFGDGFDAFSVGEIDGRFVAEVRFKGGAISNEIFVRAKKDGKTVSAPTSVLLEGGYRAEAVESLAIGKNSMIYLSDYLSGKGAIPSESDLATLGKAVKDVMVRAETILGKDVGVIYGIIPEKLSVYTALAPERLSDQISDLETARSLVRLELMKHGVDAPDIVEALKTGTADFKMFFQSSEDLTEMACYYIYAEIAKLVGERFDTVGIMSQDDLMKARYPMGRGPHTDRLGFDENGIDEFMLGVRFGKHTTEWQNGENENVDKSKAYLSVNSNTDLPRAIVVRDSKSNDALLFLAECFSEMYVLGEGEWEISDDMIKEISPDFIIYFNQETGIFE